MASLNTAHKNYLLRFVPSMAAYVIVAIAVGWLFRRQPLQGPLRYLVAVAPAAPILGVIWAMGRYLIEESDEYLRMRMVRASLWATGITLAACTAVGFLETYAEVAHTPLYTVFILYCVVFGLLQGFDKLTGRA